VIDRLAADLRRAFPDLRGVSGRNLKYMRAFARAWPHEEFVQQVAAQLPWGHTLHLLDAVKAPAEREWYARQAIENGWSRNILAHQIESRLFARRGRALTNFSRTLPAVQSELAQQIVKDPYSFSFLSLAQDAQERDLERGLTEHLRALVLELGKGFAFVGSQYHIRGSRPGLLPRLALLPPSPAMFHRVRTENGGIQARVRRQDELLSICGRSSASASQRPPVNRDHPLQGP